METGRVAELARVLAKLELYEEACDAAAMCRDPIDQLKAYTCIVLEYGLREFPRLAKLRNEDPFALAWPDPQRYA
jgi:hypothetical protein